MKVTKESGGGFKKVLAPEGVHIARVYRIIDLGTQYMAAFDKSQRQVEISWELPECLHTFKEENGEQPLVVSKTFTASLHEKSALAKTLKSWGIDLSADTFDLNDLFNVPCQLTVSHNEKGDKTYVNVDGVAPVNPKLPVPDAIKETISFSLDDFDNDVYESLPQWMQEKIAGTPEFKEVAVANDNVPAPEADDLPY